MSTDARVRAARDLHRFLGAEHVTRSPGALGAVLESLHTVVGFDWGLISRWNPAVQHSALAVRDWPADPLELWTTHIDSEPTFLGITPDAPILRVRDIPRRERVGVLYDTIFHPDRLTDAMSQRLWSRDGRFLGTVTATVAGSSSLFDDLAVDLLDLLAPRLGALLDPVPDMWPLSADLADGSAEGLVVDRAGRVLRLTGGAEASLAGPLRPLIDAVANGGPAVDSAVVLVGNRVLSVRLQAGRHGVLLLHRTVPSPFGLSVRELQILDAVADGATNALLASRFGLSPWTIATYVERLLVKTGCPNRTAAAQLATRLRLMVY